ARTAPRKLQKPGRVMGELVQRRGEQRTFAAAPGQTDGNGVAHVIRRDLAPEHGAFRWLDQHARREVAEGEGEDTPAVDVGRVAEESGAGIRCGGDRPHAAPSLSEPGLPRVPPLHPPPPTPPPPPPP